VFLLYINDITDSLGLLNCSIKLYADDAKLYSSFYVGAHFTDLVQALDSVSGWANMWQLKIATSKCITHHICTLPASTDCPYFLCNMTLQWSVSTKDLGVTIDNGLVFDQHVANIVHTASTRVYLILSSFLSRDHEFFLYRDREVLVKSCYFCTTHLGILLWCLVSTSC